MLLFAFFVFSAFFLVAGLDALIAGDGGVVVELIQLVLVGEELDLFDEDLGLGLLGVGFGSKFNDPRFPLF